VARALCAKRVAPRASLSPDESHTEAAALVSLASAFAYATPGVLSEHERPEVRSLLALLVQKYT
jgi:hypothetical protein